MGRTRIITLAIILSIIGIITTLAITLYLSWSLAVKEEYSSLNEIGRRALTRVNITFEQIHMAFKELQPQPYAPCTPQHIQLMRKLTLEIRSIEEIGYFENNQLKCTSWGVVTTKIIANNNFFTLPNGLEVTPNVNPMISDTALMIAVRDRHYNVLVNPERFVDIVFDAPIQLAVLTPGGEVLGAAGKPDLNLIRSLIKQKQNYVDDQYIISFTNNKDFIAVVIAPREILDARLSRERLVLFPFGLLLAVIFIILILWLLKQRLSPLGELNIAVEKKEFVVFYQPIVGLIDGQCVGAEALVKWVRPNGETIQPDFFIPLAEESGLILPITDQVIALVVKEMKHILVADRSLHIAINLSVEDIKTGRVIDILSHYLKNSGIHPNQIWIEATERGFMDIPSARETISKARELGYIIAIDDFGTGYSSLSTLQNFPLHILKIDKSFIDKIGTNTVVSEVTTHIIDIAKTLQLDIVAEGIETDMQAKYLKAHGVKYGQGWLYSKALIAPAFIDFYSRNRDADKRY